MEETIGKRWYSMHTAIFLLVILPYIIISCSIHNKKHLTENNVIQSNAIHIDTSIIGKQATEQTYIDPLFFIDGQLCQHLRRIFQDSNGNLWFGTNVYGLMRYNGDTLEYFSEGNGFDGGRITGIVEDKDGNIWFGKYGGLTKYDPSVSLKLGSDSFINFSEKDGLANKEVWSLIIDNNGTFWAGTMEGVSRFDREKFTAFPIPKAQVKDTTTILSYNRVSCIMEDKNGSFWFGTDGFGICKYDPSASIRPGEKSFTQITKEDGLCDNNITSIMEDRRGDIWIGTMYGGLSRYDGEYFTNFTKDGLISGIEVYGLYEDKTGNIWFPSEGFGVYRYDGESFTNFHEKEGLSSSGIICFYEDKEGRFWLGGWGGLFRYDPSASHSTGGKSFFSVTKEGPWN